MRTLRWLLGGFVLLTSLVVIAVGVALFALDDEDWTALFLRGVDYLVGDDFEVDGKFLVSMQGGASVVVEDLTVDAADGSFTLQAGSGAARVDLWALRHLTLFLEELQLRDGVVRIAVAADRTDPRIAESGGRWTVIPVIGEVLVERFSLHVENPEAEATTVDIARLALVEDASGGKSELDAYGAVDATAFSITGELGAVGDLVAPPADGFPVDVTLTSRTIEGRLAGTVASPIRGKGVDLTMSVSAPSIDGLVDVWLPEWLSLGAMRGAAHLHGDVRSLAVDEIELSLLADHGLSIDVYGAVDDVLAAGGIRLECLVLIDDAELLQRLLPETMEFVDRAVLTTNISGDRRALDFDDLGLVATSRQGDEVALSGSAGLQLTVDALPRLQLSMRGEVDRRDGAREAGRFQRLVNELDTVNVVMHASFGGELVSVDSLRLELGHHGGALLTLTGAIGAVSFEEDEWFEGLDLQIAFSSVDLARFGDLFELHLPRHGKAAGSARISGAGHHAVIEEVILDAELGQAGSVQISGTAELDLAASRMVKRIDFGVRGRTPELADVLAGFEVQVPALGAAELTGRVTGQGARVDVVYLNLGVPRLQSSLESSGSLHLGERTRLDVTSELKIDEMGTLLRTLGIESEVSLGGLSGRLQLSGLLADLSVEELTLASTGSGPATLDITGIVDHVRFDRDPILAAVAIDASLDMPSVETFAAAFGVEVPDLGAADARMVINDLDGSIGAESVVLRIVKDDAEVMRADGRIDDLFRRAEIGWTLGFDIALSPLLAYVTGAQVPDLGHVQANLEVSDEDGSLGVEHIELSSDEDQLVTIDGEGTLDDIIGGDEIEAEARITVREPTLLAKVFGVDVVGSGPVTIDGTMAGEIGDHTMEVRLSVGRSEATASSHFVMEGGKPRLVIEANIGRLYPSDFGTIALPVESDEPTRLASERAPLFTDDPIDLSMLDRIDLDLALRIDEVVTDGEGGVDQIDVGVLIKDGDLVVEPIRFDYAGGGLNGRFELRRTPTPSFRLDLEGNDIYLGQVLSQIRGISTVSGTLTMDVDLAGEGATSKSMVGSLGGKVGLVIENGHVPRRLIDSATVDTFGWTVNATAARRRTQSLSCGIGRLSVDQGLIAVEALFLDGPGLRVVGAGEVNLPEESMKLVFLPKRKRRIWKAADPVRVRGDLRAPTVSAVPARAAAREIGTFAVAGPFVFLSVRALGYLFGMVADEDAAQSPCFLEAVADEVEQAVEVSASDPDEGIE